MSSRLTQGLAARGATPFSFRAETTVDAIAFLKEVAENAIETQRILTKLTFNTDEDDGEVHVEFYTNISLGVLQNHLRCLKSDYHIMLQTLRQVPMMGNSFTRDTEII